ncbi:MAG: 2-oxo acid dehydrogenase subunit E2 [Bacteroidales bacterium]|nr:2-oxo acid dehydrogenase subunit E2 [Bacteroidales bacterium]
MPLPPGRGLSLSLPRRFVGDVMYFSRSVPTVIVERNAVIPEVHHARLAVVPRPGWLALFLKAAGLATHDVPELRRSFLTFPWPRLYEHGCSIPAVTIERDWQGEPGVFVLPLRHPELLALTEIDATLRQAKTAPLREVAAFRRSLRIGRLPMPFRRCVWWLALRVVPSWRQKYFGTIAVSSVITSGAEITTALTPLSGYLTCGAVTPEGNVVLRLMFDHRILDAAQAARYLVALEQRLQTDILRELQGMVRHSPEAA